MAYFPKIISKKTTKKIKKSCSLYISKNTPKDDSFTGFRLHIADIFISAEPTENWWGLREQHYKWLKENIDGKFTIGFEIEWKDYWHDLQYIDDPDYNISEEETDFMNHYANIARPYLEFENDSDAIHFKLSL